MDEPPSAPAVWIIGKQHWPRALLRAELIERGHEAVGYSELAHALSLLHQSVRRPRVMVVELCDLASNRDDLIALGEYGIPTVVLGGAVELNEYAVGHNQWTRVLQRPCTIGSIADVVETLSKAAQG